MVNGNGNGEKDITPKYKFPAFVTKEMFLVDQNLKRALTCLKSRMHWNGIKFRDKKKI